MVLIAQMAFSCKFYVDFARTSNPRVREDFGSLQYFNIQGLKYDDPLLPEAENIVTHPLLYLLTGL